MILCPAVVCGRVKVVRSLFIKRVVYLCPMSGYETMSVCGEKKVGRSTIERCGEGKLWVRGRLNRRTESNVQALWYD